MKKQGIALLLAVSMCVSGVNALAETAKHEHVYIVTGADGTIQSLTDNIRLENKDALDELTDETILKSIENVSGHETFTQDGATVVWQAKGADITYQGTSDQAPAITPIVSLTLDGEEITAEALKDRTGMATLTVSYLHDGEAPVLAVSVLPLPEEGVTEVIAENAKVISEAGRNILVGWAALGLDEEFEAPETFSATFRADHADLGWMMTVASADPIDALLEEVQKKADEEEIDAHLELSEAEALLTALQKGETLPETTGKTKDLPAKINELNDGLTQLNDGAKELSSGAATLKEGADTLSDGAKELSDGAKELSDGVQQVSEGTTSVKDGAKGLSDGAKELKDGAESVRDGAKELSDGAAALRDGITTAASGATALNEGLNTLTENNEALNQGAAALLAALLNTANEQLAASSLSEVGIALPQLTADNYADALDGAMAQLNPDALQATAYTQVETAVRPQVEANEAQIRAAVTTAVQAKVLEAVLQSAGLELDAEGYQAAVKAGAVSKEQAAQIEAAVTAQMSTDEAQAQLSAAVSAQIDQLVEENVRNYLANDETIAAQLSAAQAGYESLNHLKEQLDRVHAFVTGLGAYTAGVSQSAAGAASLQEGMESLTDGAATLATGAASLNTGTVTLATGAKTLSDGAKTLYDGTVTLETGAQSAATGAGTLATGAKDLYDGSKELADGAGELAEGADQLYQEGTQKLKDQIFKAEKDAAERLLPYLQDDAEKALRIYEETRDAAKNGIYDLRPEGMEGVTVYVIRTDLKK